MNSSELSGYNEKHHILPKCMGGSDDKSNIVLMPVRYHIMAHYILTFIYPDNKEICIAIGLIINCRNLHLKKFSTRTLSDIRILSREAQSKLMTGRKNPHKGVPRSEETKRKIGDSELGEKHHNFGKLYDNELKEKLSNSHKGLKISEETKQKLSMISKGRKKPKNKYINTLTGEIFNTMIELCNKFGYCRDTVRDNLKKYGEYKSIKYFNQ